MHKVPFRGEHPLQRRVTDQIGIERCLRVAVAAKVQRQHVHRSFEMRLTGVSATQRPEEKEICQRAGVAQQGSAAQRISAVWLCH